MANRSMMTTLSPLEDKNHIFEPRESQHQTPTPSTPNRSDKKPRPTAWLTAQQIRSQNPYRKVSKERSPTRGKRNQPPWHTEPSDQLDSLRLGKNPKFNTNYSQDQAKRSPTRTQTRITHDLMFEDMDTPSSETFRANATNTSTPKVNRKEWKEERFPSPNMIGRSDYPQHRETERRNTRYRSPSPPHPGSNSRLLHTAEEREAFRDIKFYENAVEEAKLDLLKCDPRRKSPHKSSMANRSMMTTLSPQEDKNHIFEPRESQHQTPTPSEYSGHHLSRHAKLSQNLQLKYYSTKIF